MKIVIIGDGAVGDSLVEALLYEGHEITVIDTDPRVIDEVTVKYDVQGVLGNGANVALQKSAGVDDCDILIAMTFGDELNLLCCMIGKNIGAKHAIARVRNTQYMRQTEYMAQNLGIDMIVNPDHEAAHEAARIIRFPSAVKLDKFAGGKVEMAEIHVSESNPLIGLKLKDLRVKYNTNVLLCVACRHGKAIIPTGDYVIEKDDELSITGSRTDIMRFFSKAGLMRKSIKSVMIMGGERISEYLAGFLSGAGMTVKIIERDEELCELLAERLPENIHIINGEVTDPDVLTDEGIDDVDACVSMTSNDKTNIIVSMFANTRSVNKVIAQVSSSQYARLCDSAGIETNIIPKAITAERVITYVRGIANIKGQTGESTLKTLYKIADDRAEALEFFVPKHFEMTGIPLRELNARFKKNLLLAAIIRDENVIYPHGQSTIEAGDSIVVVTTNDKLSDVNDIFA